MLGIVGVVLEQVSCHRRDSVLVSCATNSPGNLAVLRENQVVVVINRFLAFSNTRHFHRTSGDAVVFYQRLLGDRVDVVAYFQLLVHRRLCKSIHATKGYEPQKQQFKTCKLFHC